MKLRLRLVCFSFSFCCLLAFQKCKNLCFNVSGGKTNENKNYKIKFNQSSVHSFIQSAYYWISLQHLGA